MCDGGGSRSQTRFDFGRPRLDRVPVTRVGGRHAFEREAQLSRVYHAAEDPDRNGMQLRRVHERPFELCPRSLGVLRLERERPEAEDGGRTLAELFAVAAEEASCV